MATCPDWAKKAFFDWVESWGWDVKEKFLFPYNEIVMNVGDPSEEWPLTRLLGKLWRCTDPMPKDLCERLDLPEGSTYARAAQGILAAGRRGKYWIPRSGYRVPPS